MGIRTGDIVNAYDGELINSSLSLESQEIGVGIQKYLFRGGTFSLTKTARFFFGGVKKLIMKLEER